MWKYFQIVIIDLYTVSEQKLAYPDRARRLA